MMTSSLFTSAVKPNIVDVFLCTIFGETADSFTNKTFLIF